jgi:hypothetical protein
MPNDSASAVDATAALRLIIVHPDGLAARIADYLRTFTLLNHGKALLKFEHPDGTLETYTLYPGRTIDEQVNHARLNHYSGERTRN